MNEPELNQAVIVELLARGECGVWWLRPSHASPQWRELLDHHEIGRLERYRLPADKQRYLAAHGLVRLLLAAALGCLAKELRFNRTHPHCSRPQGKPTVVGGRDMHFSLAHAADWVVVALHRGQPIGVDVDFLGPEVNLVMLASACLSPSERSAFHKVASAARRDWLLRCWTRKEALLKATGVGLTEPLGRVSVMTQPMRERWIRDRRTDAYITDLPGRADARAALAVHRHKPESVKEFEIADALSQPRPRPSSTPDQIHPEQPSSCHRAIA